MKYARARVVSGVIVLISGVDIIAVRPKSGPNVVMNVVSAQSQSSCIEPFGGAPFHGPIEARRVVERDLSLLDDHTGRPRPSSHPQLAVVMDEIATDDFSVAQSYAVIEADLVIQDGPARAGVQ